MTRSKSIVLWTALLTAWLCNSSAGMAAAWSDVNLTKKSGTTVIPYYSPIPTNLENCYTRSDGVFSVVYTGSDLHIHQLALAVVGLPLIQQWVDSDLTKSSKATVGGSYYTDSMGYVRSDKVSVVVYTGSDGHIHEIALAGGNWHDADLNVASNTPASVGSGPKGYVRSDGVTSVVYNGSNNHIHELALVGGKWHDADLTVASKTTSTGDIHGAEPMGYIRSDKVSAVVYAGYDGHIHEMALAGGKWGDADLTVASKATHNGSSPRGYVRSDGVSSVVYTGSDSHIHEMALVSGRWGDADLTVYSKANVPIGLGGPQGYVRSDGVNSVVYGGSDKHIHEMALVSGRWGDADLTVYSKAYPTDGYLPRGCVHGGFSAVVYNNLDGIHEMELK